jgi:glycosyltransferase involved in cell wall biosynthesis
MNLDNLIQKLPLVSVVMSLYNDGKFVADAVHSILSQTFSDLEFVIINDGSIDDSLAKVGEFDDSRIRIIHLPHQGLAKSLNIGIQAAKGFYIARQDGDDISAPERIEMQLALFERDKNLGLVGSNAILIEQRGINLGRTELPLNGEEIRQNLLDDKAGNPLIHGTTMFRRKDVIQIGGYRPEFRQAQDIDLWLRLSERVEFANLPEALYFWRLRRGSVGESNWENQRDYAQLARLCAQKRRVGEPEPPLSVDSIRRWPSTARYSSWFQRFGSSVEYEMKMGILFFDMACMTDARKNFFYVICHKPINIYAWLLLILSFTPHAIAVKLRLRLQNLYHIIIWKD